MSGVSGPQSDQLLFATIDEAEAKKIPIDKIEGQAQMEAFTMQMFERADVSDRSGADSKKISGELFVASLFMDTLAQFHGGDLPPGIAKLSQYAKGRALHLRDCVTRGVTPAAPNPPTTNLACILSPGATSPGVAAQQVAAAPPVAPPPAAAAPPVAPPPVAATSPDVAATQQAPSAPAFTPVTAAPQVPVAPVVPPVAAAPPVAPVPARPAAPQAPSGIGADLSPAKKVIEAEKRAEVAKKAIDADDITGAKKAIIEALGLLEGAT